MNTPAEIVTPLIDDGWRAAAVFLTGYGAVTGCSYTSDLRAWFAWCHEHRVMALAVTHPHVELWVNDMEERRAIATRATYRAGCASECGPCRGPRGAFGSSRLADGAPVDPATGGRVLQPPRRPMSTRA